MNEEENALFIAFECYEESLAYLLSNILNITKKQKNMKKITLLMAILGILLLSNTTYAQSKKGKAKGKKNKEAVDTPKEETKPATPATPATPGESPATPASPAQPGKGEPTKNTTASPTPTSSPSPTASPTPSPAGSPSPTSSPSPTGSPTPASSPSPTASPSPAPAPAGTQPASPTGTPNNPTASPTGLPKEPVKPESTVVNDGPGIPDDFGTKAEPVVTSYPNGNVNWTQQFVEAKGAAVIDNQKFTNPAQAKLMASRGAVVVAQRNLLEIIKGVNITSETTVQDMMTTSDFIYTRIDGVVKGAQQVGEAREVNGTMEVTMRVPLYDKGGIAPAVVENVPAPKKLNSTPDGKPVVANIEPEAGAAEGLDKIAFNFKGKKIDPTMFPVIVDQNNNLVFDYSKIYDPKNGKFPKIVKSSEKLLTELGYNKNIKVLDVISADKGKIVIDNKQLKKVNWKKIGNTAAKIGKFLLMLV